MDNTNLTTNASSGLPMPATDGLSAFAMVTITLQMILMVLITSSNSLVIAAVCKFETLRDITGIFVANLAVSDLITGLSLPFQIAFFIFPEMEQIKTVCLLRFLIISFACNASMYFLVCTVFDRLVAIAFPFRYAELMTKTKAYGMVIGVWLVDIVFQSAPLLGANNFDNSPFCLYELIIDARFKLANIINGLLCAFLISCMYIRIFIIARKHIKQIQSENARIASLSSTRVKQMNAVIAIVVIIFHVSWLPFFITQLTMLNTQNVTEEKVMVANFCVFAGIINSVVNPVIYAWKNRLYRRAFKKLLYMSSEDDAVVTLSSVS